MGKVRGIKCREEITGKAEKWVDEEGIKGQEEDEVRGFYDQNSTSAKKRNIVKEGDGWDLDNCFSLG